MTFNKIKKVSIKNYKGIDFLEFSPREINIIVGRNNTGKSTLLNAITLNLYALNRFKSNGFDSNFEINNLFPLNRQIYESNDNKSTISLEIQNYNNSPFNLEIRYSDNLPEDYNIQAFTELIDDEMDRIAEIEVKEIMTRAYKYEDSSEARIKSRIREIQNRVSRDFIKVFRDTLFFRLSHENTVLIESLIQNPQKFRQRTSRLYSSPPRFSNYYLNHEVLDSLKLKKLKFMFRSQLRQIDLLKYFHELSSSSKFYDILDRLKKKIHYLFDIREVEDDINIIIQAMDNRKIFVPFKMMGDGFQSLLISNVLFELLPKGIVLLEEPENCLHPGFMDILADSILLKSESHQYFFSTHSLELIKLIIDKAEKSKKLDKIVLLRLSRNDNKIDREILLKEDIIEELNVIEIDLRGY